MRAPCGPRAAARGPGMVPGRQRALSGAGGACAGAQRGRQARVDHRGDAQADEGQRAQGAGRPDAGQHHPGPHQPARARPPCARRGRPHMWPILKPGMLPSWHPGLLRPRGSAATVRRACPSCQPTTERCLRRKCAVAGSRHGRSLLIARPPCVQRGAARRRRARQSAAKRRVLLAQHAVQALPRAPGALSSALTARAHMQNDIFVRTDAGKYALQGHLQQPDGTAAARTPCDALPVPADGGPGQAAARAPGCAWRGGPPRRTGAGRGQAGGKRRRSEPFGSVAKRPKRAPPFHSAAQSRRLCALLAFCLCSHSTRARRRPAGVRVLSLQPHAMPDAAYARRRRCASALSAACSLT